MVGLGVLEVFSVGVSDEVGAEGDFVDVGEAELSDHGDEFLVVEVGEFGGEAGGDGGGDGMAAVKELFDEFDGGDDLFCVLAADADAVSAGDASFGHDLSLSVCDAYGLCGAFAHAGVADAAAFFYGFDVGDGVGHIMFFLAGGGRAGGAALGRWVGWCVMGV